MMCRFTRRTIVISLSFVCFQQQRFYRNKQQHFSVALQQQSYKQQQA